MGLTDLYKKFLLLEKNVTIQLFSHILEYELTYEHAQSNPESNPKCDTPYIVDIGCDGIFQEDVLQIHSAYEENFDEIPINDLNDRNSIFTPFDNVVQVPYPGQGRFIDLIYHANPKKIEKTVTEPGKEHIRLPQQLLAPLCAYIGYRAHVALPAGQNSKATEHLSRYTGMCNEITLLGTLNKANLTNLKIKNRGMN